MKKTEALLIIDMLNDFVLAGAPLEVPDTRTIVPGIRNEIQKAHSVAHPVVYLCDSHDAHDKEFRKFGWPPHAVKGTKGAEIIDELRPSVDDLIIRKNSYSSFFGTTLDSTLKRLNVGSLRLTGVVTDICVLFTVYEAVLRDYTVTVVENGVAGIEREGHEAALGIMKRVLGVKIVKSELREKRAA